MEIISENQLHVLIKTYSKISSKVSLVTPFRFIQFQVNSTFLTNQVLFKKMTGSGGEFTLEESEKAGSIKNTCKYIYMLFSIYIYMCMCIYILHICHLTCTQHCWNHICMWFSHLLYNQCSLWSRQSKGLSQGRMDSKRQL